MAWLMENGCLAIFYEDNNPTGPFDVIYCWQRRRKLISRLTLVAVPLKLIRCFRFYEINLITSLNFTISLLAGQRENFRHSSVLERIF